MVNPSSLTTAMQFLRGDGDKLGSNGGSNNVGILFVKKKRKLFVVGTFAMLSTAITYHGIYNMLVQSDYQIIGFLLPIATYIPFMVWRIRKIRQKNAK